MTDSGASDIEPQHERSRPPGKGERELRAVKQEIETYVGPMPHPAHLREYEEICPGTAALLFNQFVRQAEHRRHLEWTVVERSERRATRGLYLAFVVFIALIGTGTALVFLERNVDGFATLVVTGIGSASVLVYGRREQRKEGKPRLGSVRHPASNRSCRSALTKRL